MGIQYGLHLMQRGSTSVMLRCGKAIHPSSNSHPFCQQTLTTTGNFREAESFNGLHDGRRLQPKETA